jgi:hypothetical protein
MATAEWQQFDPTELFPQAIQDLFDEDTLDLIDTLKAALDVMRAVIDTASTFVAGFVDTHKALVEALQDAIWSVVQQLFETGFYATFHIPPSPIPVMTPAEWTADVADSLTDVSDTARPILVDPSAFVGVVAVCATTTTYQDLIEQFRAMFDMFKKKIAEAAQVGRWPSREDPWTVIEGVGRAPDWTSIKLGEIVPPIGDLARKVHAFGETLTSAASGGDIYNNFVSLLFQKAETLSGFADSITTLLTDIQSMLDWEGAFVLQIYGQGDAAWVQNIIRNARGDLYEVANANYTAGAVFLATGGTTDQIDMLMDLFGLAKETTEFTNG